MVKFRKKWWLEKINKISSIANTKKESLYKKNNNFSASKSRFDELAMWKSILYNQRKKLIDLYTNTGTLPIQKKNRVPGKKTFIYKTEQILEAHLTDPNFGVCAFSFEMSMSRVHLYRLTKDFTGQSPSEYIRNYRLHKATLLLTQANKSVSEVAYLTGFNDLSHFSKCFKKVFGVCPSEYKKVEIMSYLFV
ncbi:AraC-like DNA-binding protein [Catalinimonas alkaloidigena]|uniref:helix-turn-helix domain-containing protein n=1 Tax=Catalinimonas alkaloidigena TaxID=1075417 RepID=UPI0024060B02|nr:AraC family transcriptional regulator [Catalinimonas alkaloidigena]MDF9798076.1 AraC-like DNA-binding protein [Catalinimonas alkaloidigena]